MATLNFRDFERTKDMARVTLSCWDGKSYNGERRNFRVWVSPSIPNKRFVQVPFSGQHADGKRYRVACFHEITDLRHKVSGEVYAEYYTSIE